MFDLNGPATFTQSLLTGRAAQVGVEQGQFTTCFTSSEVDSQVQAVLALASARGVNGTPSLFVNDGQVPFTGPETTYDGLNQVIRAALGG
jgi:protein-disulfide isomerase